MKNSQIPCQKILIGLFAVVCLALGSCSDDIELKNGLQSVEDGYLKLNFIVPVEETTLITRAEEGYKDDSFDERRINTLAILIWDKDEEVILQRSDFAASEFKDFEIMQDVNSSSDQNNSQGSNEFTLRIKLNDAAYVDGDRKIYAFANTWAENGPRDLLEEFTENSRKTPSDLEEVYCSGYQDKKPLETQNGLLMSGKMVSNAIVLKRSSVKISLQVDTDSEAAKYFTLTWDTDGDLTAYRVCNTNNGSYLTAPSNTTNKFYTGANKRAETSGREQIFSETVKRYDCHVSPTQVKDASGKQLEDAPYMVLQGNYNGKEYYYRIDFCNTAEDGTKTYVDLEANHWYEMHITKVSGPGYETAEEAIAAGDCAGITVEIHDHAAKILSMASDGRRELGVSPTVEAVSNAASFIIKCFDADDADLIAVGTPNTDNSTVIITPDSESESWLTIGTPVLIEDIEIILPEYTGDKDNVGKQWTVPLTINSNRDVSGKITVSWGSLSRTIAINYKAQSEAVDLFVQSYLILHDGSKSRKQNANISQSNPSNGNENVIVVDDYFEKFLKGDKATSIRYNSSSQNAYKLFGVDAMAMGESKARNSGLHFPIMYGENDKLWWYEYYVRLNADLFGSKQLLKVELENKTGIWTNIQIKMRQNNSVVDLPAGGIYYYNNFSIFLAKPTGVTNEYEAFEYGENSSTQYGYSINYLLIKDVETNQVLYRMPLYHTGFFHLDTEGAHRIDIQKVGATYPEEGFYYYEVHSMEGQHWLDRNLGAKSNGMDILKADGSSMFSSYSGWPYGDGSIGGYYYPAQYFPSPSGTNSPYDNPENHLYSDLCPPGYRLPRKTEFDRLRLSPNFVSEHYKSNSTGVNYYSSYYDIDGNPVNRVYFPKGRYKNGGIDFVGDAEAGYYWTGSRASGTEKEEIGKWLRVLSLSGATSSYVYGDISSYGMNVRCVANDGTNATSDKQYTVSFNVKGATNVYLYTYSTIDNGSKIKSPLMTWPGKGVGDALTMDGGAVLNFSYSSTIDPENEDLFVIFTYVKNGVTTILASDGNNGLAPTTTSLSDAKGWKVKVGANYYFSNCSTNPVIDSSGSWNSITNDNN